jgi:hypothetical protein
MDVHVISRGIIFGSKKESKLIPYFFKDFCSYEEFNQSK